MKDEFNETTTATLKKPLESIDMAIFSEGREELRSNDVPLITVQTADDAMRQIVKNNTKKIFVICSGTVGRYLVPEIMRQYPYVHDFYVYAYNIAIHVDWAEECREKYGNLLKMFNFHSSLLVRLTREIANYFIKQGKMFLQIGEPQDALICFNHARNLEIGANVRDKVQPNHNSTEPNPPQPDFREHLDLLEGNNGLICQAETAVHEQGIPQENT